MSGSGMFTGADYQAGVVAWLYVHILLEQRLNWFPLLNDRPTAVAAEVGGPGDDLRIDIAQSTQSVELQAKHGLTGAAALRNALTRIAETLTSDATHIVLAVDRTSSTWIHKLLPDDLDRLRQSREDAIRQESRALLASLTQSERAALPRVHVKVLDVDDPEDPEAKWAISALQQVLDDDRQADIAWRLLRDDATTLCKKRGRRTLRALRSLLAAHDLKARLSRPMEQLNHQLDASKALLAQHKAKAVLALLASLEAQFAVHPPDAPTRHRLLQHRAAAFAQLGRFADSLDAVESALQYDATGLAALLTGTTAAISLARFELAQQWIDRAERHHPDDSHLWLFRLELARATQAELPAPPSDVANSPDYRTGLCTLSLHYGDPQAAADLSRQLLADGVRTAEVLVLRALALLTNDWGDVGVYEPAVAQEAEKLASAALAESSDDYTLRRAYFARSVAMRSLGRPEEAYADIRSARALQPDDPVEISQSAQAELAAGRFGSAYEVLCTPVTAEYPLLLAFRASALANLGKTELAAEDVARALADATQARDVDAVRLACASAAMDLQDLELAQRALAEVSEGARQWSRYALARGRLAFRAGDLEAGRKWLEDAGQRDEKMRWGILSELGCLLLQAGSPADAVHVFSRVPHIPRRVMPAYVTALLAAGELSKADEIVQQRFDTEPVEDWALSAAVQISIERDDVEGGIAHLQRLSERSGATDHARLELIRLLVRVRRHEEARPVVEELVGRAATLGAKEQMALAQGLHLLGDRLRGLRLAFEAYRRDEDDPDMHQALAVLALEETGKWPTVETVGTDSHVRLRGARGDETREYTIFSASPVRAKNGEMTEAAATELGLMGRGVGDVVRLESPWGQEAWRIETIEPAIQYVVRDILENYSSRFPTRDFFAKGFSLAEGGGVADFAPIIAQVHGRERRRKLVLEEYQKHCLPLSFVANSTGASIDEVMEGLAFAESGPPLFAEWSDAEGEQWSTAAVAGAGRVVLSETALWTAYRLKLLDVVGSLYEVVIPQAVADDVAARFDQLERHVRDGLTFVSARGPGMQMHEMEAGAGVLVRARDEIRAKLEWLEKNARIVARPLGAVSERGTAKDVEDAVGRSAYYCVELAVHGDTMYCDDLGLRRMALERGGRSFSTISLIAGLAKAGTLAREDADAHMLWLAEWRYCTVPMSVTLMCRGVQKLSPAKLVDVLAIAGPPRWALKDVARMAAGTLKWVATHLVGTSLASVTRAFLDGMSRHWGRHSAADALMDAVREELRLLPMQLPEIVRECRRGRGVFGRGH